MWALLSVRSSPYLPLKYLSNPQQVLWWDDPLEKTYSEADNPSHPRPTHVTSQAAPGREYPHSA